MSAKRSEWASLAWFIVPTVALGLLCDDLRAQAADDDVEDVEEVIVVGETAKTPELIVPPEVVLDGPDHDHDDQDGHDHEGDGDDDDGEAKVAHRAEERAIWKGFVRYLYASEDQDLLPEPLRNRDGSVAEGDEILLDFDVSDPIKGVLFRASGSLIDLDAKFAVARGKPLSEEDYPVARRLAGELDESENRYLQPYGVYYGALLDLQAEEYDAAMDRLRLLEASPYFLPRESVRRLVVECYVGKGQTTLAILDLQVYLSVLAPERESERAWGLQKLKELRADHPGPLLESGKTMRSISDLLAAQQLGEETRGKQEHVELVLEKIVDILESPRCGSCGKLRCADCGRKTCPCGGIGKPCKGCQPGPGSGAGGSGGSGKGGSALAKGNTPGDGPAEDTVLKGGTAAEADLRDASTAEREAWGRINDRQVARSLRELWDKIPRSYRLMVTQYYRDLSEIE